MQQTNYFKKVYDDFKKSGISEDVIHKYIEKGYLTTTQNYWQLYYPDLIDDKVSEYYTRRNYNNENAKYIKPKGECSRLFRPLDLSPVFYINPSDYIIITEGEKKAIKAVQEGFNCIALSGVWAWKQKADGEITSDIIPDIANFNLQNKIFYLCYDNDLWQNQQVKNALYQFAGYLIQEKHALVKVITLPQCYPKLGLDDFLIKYGKSEFQKLMNNAELLTIQSIQHILSNNNSEIIYPLEIFPENIKHFFIDLQKRQDAPIEYLTSSFLGGISTIMDGKYAILVDKSKNWIDHPILWTAIVGNASQKKSPCLDLFKKIIDKYEEDLNKDYEEQLKAYNQAMIDYKIDLKKYERNRLLKNPDLSIKQPVEPKQPQKGRLTTQSQTVEALSKAILKNSISIKRGITSWNDELIVLLKSMGQYKRDNQADEAYYLQAWKRKAYSILRQNQDTDYTIYPSHNLIGTIQPSVLNKTLFANGLESTNGMVERWLFVCSDMEETGIKYSKNTPLNMSLIQEIYDKLYQYNGDEKLYSFNKEAQEVFDDFCRKIILEKKSSKHIDLLKNYMQKQTDYVARFSLVLHCIEYPQNLEISSCTVRKAIKLSDYFTKCFKRLLNKQIVSMPAETFALDYIKTRNLKSISPTQLYKSNTSKYKSKNEAQIILENLSSKCYGRLVKSKNGGTNFIVYT